MTPYVIVHKGFVFYCTPELYPFLYPKVKFETLPGTYFIKTETDPTGGTTYTITGTSQLLSVPYALYASNASNISLIKDSKFFFLYITDAGTLITLPKISVEKPFSALPTVTDVDGNSYGTVKIGTQIWMSENLKTTKYNDGTPIPNITDNSAWAALAIGGYCDYDNNTTNSTTYGKLYNWFTVDNNAGTKVASNGSKNVC